MCIRYFVRLLKGCLALFIAYVLQACVSHQTPARVAVDIAESVRFTVLPAGSGQLNYSLLQSVRAEYGNETQDLLVQIESTAEKLVMVVLTATGTRLATISLIDGVVSSEQLSVLPASFQVEQMLAAYQLSTWPMPELSRAIAGLDVRFTESAGIKRRRELTASGKPLIEIVTSSNNQGQQQVLYRHLQWQYQITSTTLERLAL
ncbi:DUF3261 domain-containing protein [Oceanicoccus sp. KOV_DT_Chl]|uniref:DUF3261 domain-containing protein n=1 Tax=Oceanicoccus sp. KOV_DT_Chl TaxID=1904639 RepID=UPI000C7B78AA|nr:DUF3261 domain-containing protein [Oceanicoccus sp. KOV_DT_Chl]